LDRALEGLENDRFKKAITDTAVALSAKEAAAEMKVAQNSEQVAASVAADKALTAVDGVRSLAMRPPSGRKVYAEEIDAAQPMLASVVGRAMSAVGDIGVSPRLAGMEPGVFVAGAAAAHAAFDQNALKLATAIKNLCDGMHLLEEKQNASIAQLQELFRSVEEKTIALQGDQKAVKAAMATAKKAIRTSQHLSGQEAVPLRHEERLQKLETQVASLSKWQESWFVDSVTKKPSSSVDTDVKQTPDSEQSKELYSKIQALERKSDYIRQLCETVNAIGERGEQVSLEVRELKRHIATQSTEIPLAAHIETRMSSQEISQNLESLIEMNRLRLEKKLEDLSERLDHMQDMADTQKHETLKRVRQVPEVVQKLDQLWEECKYHFSKVKEHDIHFSFFRSSFESHKQQMLGIDDSFSYTRDAQGYSQDLSEVPAEESPSRVILSQNEDDRLIQS
jgi:regulator of replication initiation timing/microcompartment protein CcmL/EutN